MSDSQDSSNSQSSQQMSQQSYDSILDLKGQDYQIQKSQSANTSFNISDESQNMGSVRRIKSDNYQKKNEQISFNYKQSQNGNSRYHHENNKQNKQYPQDNQRRNNRRNNKPNNFSNINNSAFPSQAYNNYPNNSNTYNKNNDNYSNQINRKGSINNKALSRPFSGISFFPHTQPPLPHQPSLNPKGELFEQLNQNQPMLNPILPQSDSLIFLQNSTQVDGSFYQNRIQQFQNITKGNSNGVNLLINSSSQFSSKELDNQIKQELNSYNEEQNNMNYSSWASILNNKENLLEDKNDDLSIKNTIQTDFYQEELQKQLDESVKRLDKGNLVHYQVDISEQDNCSPFEYLKQFRIENNGNRSLREEYLDLMANLDLYTEKLYYAIQDKATDHLKKNNFNTQTLLQNNYNNYQPTSFAAQQQQQISMQTQRNNAKSIIKGAVQTVLEYSENRTVVPRYAREGDWLCQCGNLNFSYRNTCNKCLTMKPKYEYTKNTELHLKLDQMEKQLMNIDSTITSPPPQDQIITQQRQIILSDFIWICKCCRSINYCKTSTCVSCNMQKYINRTKLIEITKNSQKKLSKYALKMQERYQKNIQALQKEELQQTEQENQPLDNSVPQPSNEDFTQLKPDEALFNISENDQLNSQQYSSSSSSSDEGNSLNYSLQNGSINIEDLNTTQQQFSLNNSQQQILLNLSTDSDTKQNQSQSQNVPIKEQQCIFILDQLNKSCDADYSSSDSLEYMPKKSTSSIKKSIKKSLVKSSKSKKKSSKAKELSILEELKDEPQKRFKLSQDSISVEDNDNTILDETTPEVQQEYQMEININTTDDSFEESYQTQSTQQQEINFKQEIQLTKNEQQQNNQQIEDKIISIEENNNEVFTDSNENVNEMTQDAIMSDQQEENQKQSQIQQQFKLVCNIIEQKQDKLEEERLEEESLLMGLNDDDFLIDFDN